MLILALVILAPLAWLVIRRMQRAGTLARGGWRWPIACLGAALALRVGLAAPALLRVALLMLAIGAIAVWLHRHGHGGDGPDDGRDPPVDPEPDAGSGERAALPRDRLDADAFDRARADWEHALNERAPD